MSDRASRETLSSVRLRLHERVQSYIAQAADGEDTAESFEELALAIVRYQVAHIPAYARLCASAGRDPDRASDPRLLPAVPTDAFRLTRIAAHPAAEEAARFRTSGTTATVPGEHSLSTTRTYEQAALAWGRWALFFDEPSDLSAIVLGPRFAPARDSSLHFMFELFTTRWAARSAFLQATAETPIDEGELARACAAAARRNAPAILLGTSFAFVHALERLAGARFSLPAGSRAMHTGGFKGRSREVEPSQLKSDIARTFGLEPDAVVGEYGMTELSSQLYEGTWRARAGLSVPVARASVFVPPPWLRAVATDPETLLPLPDGEVGILRFEDLANVDSALAIQTVDRGRLLHGNVELLGRLPGAPPRGCSLVLEELLGP